MIITDRRKMEQAGSDGAGDAGAGDNPNPTDDAAASDPNGSNRSGSGKKGDFRSLYDNTKADMLKYKKELREAKARLAEFDEAAKVAEEKKLLDQQNYKELLDKRDAEIADWKGQVDALNGKISEYGQREINGSKLNAFLDGADFNIDTKYMGFVDLDRIQIDENGVIDSASVQEARDIFLKEHPQLISRGMRSPRFKQPGQGMSEKVTRAQNLMDYVSNPKGAIRRAAKGLVE